MIDIAALRKVLFHARRSRFSQFRYPVCAHGRANLLGPVVSGGVANRRARRRPGDFLSTSIGWHPHEKSHSARRSSTHGGPPTRALPFANGVYAAVVNRVGFEGKTEKGDPGLEFWEIPLFADPFGQVISELPNNSEEILVVDATPQRARKRAATGRFSATAASTLSTPS